MLEKLGYAILVAVAIAWLVMVIVGLIETLPVGIIGLALIVGIGLLFIKVLKERLTNKEDDYYSKNVKK